MLFVVARSSVRRVLSIDERFGDDAEQDDGGANEARGGEAFAEEEEGEHRRQHRCRALEQGDGAGRDAFEGLVLQKIAQQGAGKGEVKDGGPVCGRSTAQGQPAFKEKGADKGHHHADRSLYSGEGKGVHFLHGRAAGNKRTRQKHRRAKPDDFAEAKARETAAKKIQPHHNEQLQRNVHPAVARAMNEKSEDRREDDCHRAQKRRRGGGGEVEGNVVEHIAASNAQRRHQPKPHRHRAHAADNASAKNKQQRRQRDGVAHRHQRIHTHRLISRLRNRVTKAIKHTLQQNQQGTNPHRCCLHPSSPLFGAKAPVVYCQYNKSPLPRATQRHVDKESLFGGIKNAAEKTAAATFHKLSMISKKRPVL